MTYENEALGNIANAKRWIKRACGRFSASEFSKEVGITNISIRDKILDELIHQKLIERDINRNGWYVRVDSNIQPMDWINAEMDFYPIWLPLSLNEKAYVSPGNVIVLAGETNAGKTAFVLKTIHKNLQANGGGHEKISLFNSEMHPAEVKGRLLSIDNNILSWKGLNVYSRARDFHLVIDPEGFNVIDFMENLDNFWQIGQKIEALHNTLQGGIAIVCLQKKKGEELARGGDFTLEKARLGLSMSFDGHVNFMRITKCKAPVVYPNPQGQEIDFTIQKGCDLIPYEGSEWEFVTKNQRESRTKAHEGAAQLESIRNKNRGFGG